MFRRRSFFVGLSVFLALGLLFAVVETVLAQGKLPGGVTSRLKKIEGFLKKTEERLAAGSTSRNDFERAEEALAEIKKQYPDAASHGDVAAAEQRIQTVKAALDGKAAGKEQAKTAAAGKAASDEQTLVGWAQKLGAFKPDDKLGAKGLFGISTEDVDVMLACKPAYEEAKALLAEFMATGLNKDDHHELRQADYDIRTSMENYEGSCRRIPEKARQKVDEALKWFAGRSGATANINLDKGQAATIAKLIDSAHRLAPNAPETKTLLEKKAELDQKMEEADKTILQSRRMGEDKFKGGDAEALKAMARSVVEKHQPGAKILRVHLLSPSWNKEAAVEWTDTTNTALQHRVTESVNAQVAVEQGDQALIYTVYLNKDKVSGQEKALTGHVMFKDRALRQNIP